MQQLVVSKKIFSVHPILLLSRGWFTGRPELRVAIRRNHDLSQPVGIADENDRGAGPRFEVCDGCGDLTEVV
jgi:hypothetical protein